MDQDYVEWMGKKIAYGAVVSLVIIVAGAFTLGWCSRDCRSPVRIELAR